jgi:hypothetical protein
LSKTNGFISRLLILFHDLHVCPAARTALSYYNIFTSVGIGKPALFFFKIVLPSWQNLYFYANFRFILLTSSMKPAGILRDSIESYKNL